MGFLQRFLEALPKAAANPLAFIAYVVVIAAWLWAYQRTARLKVLLSQLELVPKNQRTK